MFIQCKHFPIDCCIVSMNSESRIGYLKVKSKVAMVNILMILRKISYFNSIVAKIWKGTKFFFIMDYCMYSNKHDWQNVICTIVESLVHTCIWSIFYLIIPHATSCGGYNVFDPSVSQSVS